MTKLTAVMLLVCACGKNEKAQTSPYKVAYTNAAPTIDGKIDDVYSRAKWTANFVGAKGGPSMPLRTRAKLLWDDTYLYLLADMEDPDVFSPVTERDGPLWRHDVVEIFVDHDGNQKAYAEVQVNPNNTHLDYWFPTTRARPANKAWDAKMVSAVSVNGTKNDAKDQDKGWIAEAKIPLAVLDGPSDNDIGPGTQWHFNIVRIDKPRKGRLRVHSLFKITYRDFHALDLMGQLEFTK